MANPTIDRLEAVTAKLETLAANLARGGTRGGAGGDDVKLAPSAEGWNDYYSDFVQPFIDASKKLNFAEIARDTESSWKNVGALMTAAPNAKKPSQADLTKFVKPAVAGITEAGKRNRDPQDKGFSELIQGLGWIMNPKPMPTIQGQLEAADFWLTKVLTTNKDKPNKQDYRDWVAKAKEMMNEMKNYVKQFHRMGVDYKGQGSIFDAQKAGGPAVPPAGGAPPPALPPPAASSAPAPKASSGGGGGGMGAVLADLQKGSNITSGLKKVTSNMKTKNRKDRGGLVSAAPKAKAAGPSKWAQKSQVDKPASLRQERGNWIVEYQKDPLSPVSIEGEKYNKDQMKRGIFIYRCGESHIVMPDGKVKNITIDSCKKTKVYIQGVVSTIEVVNCQSITVVLQKEVYKPLTADSKKEGDDVKTLTRSISVDKTNGCQILCDEESKKCLELISSMISEVNIQVPGATENDDPVEMAVAEQFKTVVKYPLTNGQPDFTKKPELVTESVKHG